MCARTYDWRSKHYPTPISNSLVPKTRGRRSKRVNEADLNYTHETRRNAKHDGTVLCVRAETGPLRLRRWMKYPRAPTRSSQSTSRSRLPRSFLRTVGEREGKSQEQAEEGRRRPKMTWGDYFMIQATIWVQANFSRGSWLEELYTSPGSRLENTNFPLTPMKNHMT